MSRSFHDVPSRSARLNVLFLPTVFVTPKTLGGEGAVGSATTSHVAGSVASPVCAVRMPAGTAPGFASSKVHDFASAFASVFASTFVSVFVSVFVVVVVVSVFVSFAPPSQADTRRTTSANRSAPEVMDRSIWHARAADAHRDRSRRHEDGDPRARRRRPDPP